MKLRRLYTNKPDIFPDVRFSSGLNVVFAKVKEANLNRDSHNLGKSFLITVIDFVLLVGMSREHPFRVHDDVFQDFVFYAELEAPRGEQVLVRRSVKGRQTVFIHVHRASDLDGRTIEDKAWSHANLGIENATQILESILRFDILQNNEISFRHGLSYFLRRQADYNDPFRLSAFLGSDQNWKPYVALLLGFDAKLVQAKYDADKKLEKLTAEYKAAEAKSGTKAKDYDELRATIELRDRQIATLRSEVDAFRFASFDSELQRKLVEELDARLSEANDRLYQVNFDLQEIERSLGTELRFDIKQIRRVFEETNTYFPPELLRSYEQLVNFNTAVSGGRTSRLKQRRAELSAEREELNTTIVALDAKRSEALSTLSKQPSLEKYRTLQQELLREERDLDALRDRLKKLDAAGEIRKELQEAERRREELGQRLEEEVLALPPKMKEVRRVFAEHAKRVLGIDAMLVASLNSNQNIDFRIKTLDRDRVNRETSEGKGNSYKKMLCACFDLAILECHASEPFYRFVYHDGIFEGLDNRRKVQLLADVRDFCKRTGVQYILTVIDSDLPRDDKDGKLMFGKDEIARELHDGGDDGRLFRMAAF